MLLLMNEGLVASVWAEVVDVSYVGLAFALCLFLVATFLSSARLWAISRDINSPITIRESVVAMTASTLVGTLFLNSIGQIAMRSTLLARWGTPVSNSLVMSGYERAIALVISVTLALVGASYLFGGVTFDLQTGGSYVVKITVLAVAATALGGYLGWGRLMRDWRISQSLLTSLVRRGTRTVLLTISIQLCTMFAYVILAGAINNVAEWSEIASAAFIVMFISSIPISFAGWGVRELSSVLALGTVGIPPDEAVAIAILIGVLSSGALVIGLVAGLLSGSSKRTIERSVTNTAGRADFSLVLAWFLPLATATAIFFQIHVPTSEQSFLNVNLADILVLSAGALFAVIAASRRTWPAWNELPALNHCIIALTVAFSLAFAISLQKIGWTTWTSTKYIGWYVILAYALTGALAPAMAGKYARTLLLMTFVGAGTAIAIYEIFLHSLRFVGYYTTTWRSEGLASNPNAFAFQLLMVACVALATIRSTWITTLIVTMLIGAIWLTGSRAGMGTVLILLAATACIITRRRRLAAYLALFCLSLMAAPTIIDLASPSSTSLASQLSANRPHTNIEASNAERLETIRLSWQIFLDHPIFGSGLGYFAETRRIATGIEQVVHSTPLWLLAEFGIIGTLVFLVSFLYITVRNVYLAVRGDAIASLVVLVLICFSSMSLVHELFYQRTLWFILGALLISPHVLSRVASSGNTLGSHSTRVSSG